MLISEQYRELNAQKHRTSPVYGSYGDRLAEFVRKLAKDIGATSILDYGCGKRQLEKALGFAINNYDPAIPGCEASPEPADLVICADVLEHVEPECLENVLDDLVRVTKEKLILMIDTAPANKHLPDGRNAHQIIEPMRWWMPKILQRWELEKLENKQSQFLCICRPRRDVQ